MIVAVDQVTNYWVYVGAGYGLTVLALGGYSLNLMRKGRKLSRHVDPDKRRWM